MCMPEQDTFTDVEVEYIDAVGRFAITNAEATAAEQDVRRLARDVRAPFGGDRVAAVTRDFELVSEAINNTVGPDSKEGRKILRAATSMMQVVEAVANGADPAEAMVRMALGEDPRTPVQVDPFEGVTLGD